MKCPACGNDCLDSARFCDACGASLANNCPSGGHRGSSGSASAATNLDYQKMHRVIESSTARSQMAVENLRESRRFEAQIEVELDEARRQLRSMDIWGIVIGVLVVSFLSSSNGSSTHHTASLISGFLLCMVMTWGVISIHRKVETTGFFIFGSWVLFYVLFVLVMCVGVFIGIPAHFLQRRKIKQLTTELESATTARERDEQVLRQMTTL